MKTTRRQLRQMIQEEIQKEYGYSRRPAHTRPDYGEGNLTIEDVQELFPSLSRGEQDDIWDKYKHLNNAGELKAAILGL